MSKGPARRLAAPTAVVVLCLWVAAPTTAIPEPVCEGCMHPGDPDADGFYEDVNGDGVVNATDAAVLHRALDRLPVRPFDFDGDRTLGLEDRRALMAQIPLPDEGSPAYQGEALAGTLYTIGKRILLTDPPTPLTVPGIREGNLSAVRASLPQIMTGSDRKRPRRARIVVFSTPARTATWDAAREPVREQRERVETLSRAYDQIRASSHPLNPFARVQELVTWWKLHTARNRLEERNATAQDRLEEHRSRIQTEHRRFRQDLSGILDRAPGEGAVNRTILETYRNVLNGVVINATPAVARRVAALPYVETVTNDSRFYYASGEDGTSTGWLPRTGIDGNRTGKGVTVAVIGSGVDYRHPALGGCSTEMFLNGSCPTVVGGYDVAADDPVPLDHRGEGTHTAGIVAARDDVDGDGRYDPAEGEVWGIAPDADLLAYKVGPTLRERHLLAALDRTVDPNGDGRYRDRADIALMTVSGPGDPAGALGRAVRNTARIGVLPVVPSGNFGPIPFNALQMPGASRPAVTVGALDGRGRVADYSTRRVIQWQDRVHVKPDIVAPGTGGCGPAWKHGVAADQCPGSGSTSRTGTAVSAAYVTGVAARLLEAHPGWSGERVKTRLLATTSDTGAPFNLQGYGAVDPSATRDSPRSPFVGPVAFTGITEVVGDQDLRVEPGETIRFGLVLRNGGRRAEAVNISIRSTHPGAVVRSPATTSYGAFEPFEERTRNLTFALDTGVQGVVGFRLGITADGHTRYIRFGLEVYPPPTEQGWPRGNLRFDAVEPVTPLAADLDGDGRPHIVAVDAEKVYRWNRTGGSVADWPRPARRPSLAAGNLTVEPGDELAVLAGQEARRAELRVHDGIGRVAWSITVPGRPADHPVIADVDTDDRTEVVFASSTAWDRYTITVTDGATPATSFPVEAVTGIAAGDVNRDGRTEIVVATGANGVAAYRPDGTVVWRQPTPRPARTRPALADIDADPRLEVLVTTGQWGIGRTTCGIHAFDGSGGNEPGWPRMIPCIGGRTDAPLAADVAAGPRREVIVGSLLGRAVHVLDETGSPLRGWPLRFFNVVGSPVAVDAREGGKAELLLPLQGLQEAGMPSFITVLDGNGTSHGLIGPRPFHITGAPTVTNVTPDGEREMLYQELGDVLGRSEQPGTVFLRHLETDTREESEWGWPHAGMQNTACSGRCGAEQ